MTTPIELSAKLAEIGSQLKQVREDKDLTLDQVQASTLIPKTHLQAIEEGNLDRLPELVYVQGFIRKYGQAIGMVEIATEFPGTNAHQRSAGEAAFQPELRPWHLYAIYVTIVIASVSILAILFQEPLPRKNGNTPTTLNKSQTEVAKPVNAPLATPLKAVNVSIEMLGESWMRVVVDGNLDFEGIMPEGEVKQWSAEKEIILRTGNASAVQVQFNQTPPQVLGAEGEVVELVFDRNAVTPLP